MIDLGSVVKLSPNYAVSNAAGVNIVQRNHLFEDK